MVLERAQETWTMVGLGAHFAIERAEIGNSRPTVVRTCALLDRSDSHSNGNQQV